MGLQEDLIGQERDRKGDEALRAKLHQEWLEQQDAQQVAQVMQGVRNGFRRKRAGHLLDHDVSSHTHPLKQCFCTNLLRAVTCLVT